MPAGRLHAYDASRKTSRLRCQQEDYVYDASRKTSRLRCRQEDFTLTMPSGRLHAYDAVRKTSRLRCQQKDYVYDARKKHTLTISAGRVSLRCTQEGYVYDACGRKTMLMSPTRQLLTGLHRKTSPEDLIIITKVFLQSKILSRETSKRTQAPTHEYNYILYTIYNQVKQITNRHLRRRKIATLSAKHRSIVLEKEMSSG